MDAPDSNQNLNSSTSATLFQERTEFFGISLTPPRWIKPCERSGHLPIHCASSFFNPAFAKREIVSNLALKKARPLSVIL
jgi:hypothetical protein